jgi:ABC-type nitrate/sulfonate/bicarbonate transport system substrate-binding protein
MSSMDIIRTSAFGRSPVHEAAVRHGFYASEGLEVEADATQASKTQVQQLVDDVWQVISTNADNIVWWVEDNGADILIIMATESQPNQNFVVRREITDYPDVRGKILAADAAKSGYSTPLRVLLQRNGLTEEGGDFTFIEVGDTGRRVEAMRAGQAVGAMINAGGERALAPDGFHVLDSINPLYQHYAGISAVRRGWAEEHPDLLVRYLRAYLRALVWTKDPANATAFAELTGRRDDAPLTEAVGTPAPPPFSWAGLQEMLDMRQSVGLLRGAPDPRRFADDRFYREAVAGL